MEAPHQQIQARGHRATALLALVVALGWPTLSAAPFISEFVADNQSGLTDEENSFEDWIEIYNPDPQTANLGGYYLTDNPNNLDKWRIPSPTSLGSGQFLVIFASGKDRVVPGQNLHTNFRLDDAGEYLALVGPDGSTVISQYPPTYPDPQDYPVQFDDASYGYEQIPTTVEDGWVDADEACRVLVPADASQGITWTRVDFDASAWTAGALGVGYDRGDDYRDLISTDIEQDAFETNGSVLIRVPFTATDLDEILALRLELQYDDGFAAYINGVRVAGANGPINPSWDATATEKRSDAEVLDFATFDLSSNLNLINDGANILAIQVMNSSADDGNLLARARLTAIRVTELTTGELAYFDSPTPGRRNGDQEERPTGQVSFSHASQTFVDPFRVTLSSPFEGDTIRYTLDGSEPRGNSLEYTGGTISIADTKQLRARAYGPDNVAGPVSMRAYIKIDQRLATFSSNLPIVFVEHWGKGRPSTDPLRDAFLGIIEPDEESNRAHLLGEFTIATRCGVKIRGSSSAGWEKYHMSVEARNEEGLDKGIRPIGMPRESDWILNSKFQFDHALMRNDLIYKISRQTGEYASRSRMVEVFNHTTSGDMNAANTFGTSSTNTYFGVYSLMEKIKRDDDRVPVARLDRRDNREPDVTGGYIFKKDRLDPGDSGFSVASMGTLGWVEPKQRDVTAGQRNWLTSHLNELSAALTRPDYTNPTTGKHFTEYIDQDSWLRHHWLNTLAMNVDGFRLSGYYYKHRVDTNDGRVGAGPIWDFDRTMGSTDGRDDNPSQWDGTGDSSRTWDDGRYPWWGQALRNPDFRQAHTDLWQEFRKEGNPFHLDNIWGVIDEFEAQLAFEDPEDVNTSLNVGGSPAQRNYDRWRRGNRDYSIEVRNLRTWLRTRVGWIDRQYTTPPRFSDDPGVVPPGLITPGDEFAFDSDNVLYTTDGTDPRLPGGDVSSSATRIQAGTPVMLDQTTVVTARAREGTGLTAWSGPVTGLFLVGPIADESNFVLTELHYAPVPASTAEEIANSDDPSDFEFIEMRNISPTDTIDLTGVHFERGIEFSFTGSDITSLAPGEHVLIVRNRAAFEARYGSDHSDRIAGMYAPTRLENDGERIQVVNGVGDTIIDFTYNDKLPWPEDAGFTGYSLVLNSSALPMPDYGDASNWRISRELGGSPNASESSSFVGDPNADDDDDGYEKVLEHALGTDDTVAGDTAEAFRVNVESFEVDALTKEYLTITYQRNLAADDVDLHLEISFTGLEWERDDSLVELISEVNQGDGTSLVTYRLSTPVDFPGIPEAFVRLRATLQ